MNGAREYAALTVVVLIVAAVVLGLVVSSLPSVGVHP